MIKEPPAKVIPYNKFHYPACKSLSYTQLGTRGQRKVINFKIQKLFIA